MSSCPSSVSEYTSLPRRKGCVGSLLMREYHSREFEESRRSSRLEIEGGKVRLRRVSKKDRDGQRWKRGFCGRGNEVLVRERSLLELCGELDRASSSGLMYSTRRVLSIVRARRAKEMLVRETTPTWRGCDLRESFHRLVRRKLLRLPLCSSV